MYDKKKISIIVVATMNLAFAFLSQLSMGLIALPFQHSFSLTASQLGLIIGSYYYLYSLMQIPAGVLVDMIGVRPLLMYGHIIAGLSYFIFASTQHVLLLFVSRFMIGAGLSFSFVALFSVIKNQFLEETAGFWLGLCEMLALCVFMMAMFVQTHWLRYVSWQKVMVYMGLISLCLSVLNAMFMDKPSLKIRQGLSAFCQQFDRFYLSVCGLLRVRTLWLAGLYAGILFSVLTVFEGLWALPFFVVDHGLSLKQAAYMNHYLLIGVMLGCPVFGRITLPENRKLVLSLLPLFTGTILMIIGLMSFLNIYLLRCLVLALGFFASVYILPYIYASDLAPKNLSATSVGFVNFIVTSIAPVFQFLFGYILDFSASKHAYNTNFLPQDYQMPMLFFTACMLGMVSIGWFLARDWRTLLVDKQT
jgi:MFS family permease